MATKHRGSLLAPTLAALLGACTHAQPASSEGRPSTTTADAGTDAATHPDAEPPGDAAAAPPDAAPPELVAEPDDAAATVFDQTRVRDYHLTIAPADLAAIDADPVAEAYVPATLEVDGETVQLAARYKGSYGAFLRPCTDMITGTLEHRPRIGKCSLKLAFDEYDPNARFHGLKKLNLHSMNQDPSMLRERLGYSLFRESGVAAPRAMHVRLFVNGELQGLFVAVENVDGRFTRARFAEGGEGNLYKEVWPMHDDPATYLAALQTNEAQNPSVQSMLDLENAARTGPAAVEALLDRDYVVRYVAADRVMANDDGAFHWYCSQADQGKNPGDITNHNYFWYEAAAGGRLWIVPWDMDHSFLASKYVQVAPEWRATAECVCGATITPQLPASCDPLIATWASWTTDYERAVDAFLAGPFRVAKVQATIETMRAQIAPLVEESQSLNGAPTASTWTLAVDALARTVSTLHRYRGFPYQ